MLNILKKIVKGGNDSAPITGKEGASATDTKPDDKKSGGCCGGHCH